MSLPDSNPDKLLAALLAYHALAPALAECVNECGEAVLYSDLHVANEAAKAVLSAPATAPPASSVEPESEQDHSV